jgi:hypothetical protein
MLGEKRGKIEAEEGPYELITKINYSHKEEFLPFQWDKKKRDFPPEVIMRGNPWLAKDKYKKACN